MDPDLMGPACLGKDFEEGKPLEPFNNPPSCDGRSSLFGSGGHPFPLRGMSSDLSVNDPFILRKPSLGHSHIDLFYRPVLELLRELLVRLVVFGHDHDAGGVLVQSVDDSGSEHAIDPGEIPAMVDQGIDQSA